VGCTHSGKLFDLLNDRQLLRALVDADQAVSRLCTASSFGSSGMICRIFPYPIAGEHRWPVRTTSGVCGRHVRSHQLRQLRSVRFSLFGQTPLV
jgi:hypothetical protein